MAALSDDVELDPVEKSLVTDRPGVGSPLAEGFEIDFAGAPHVGVVDGGEGDQLDRVDLDPTPGDAVAAASLYLGTAPQPERDGDLAGQHVSA